VALVGPAVGFQGIFIDKRIRWDSEKQTLQLLPFNQRDFQSIKLYLNPLLRLDKWSYTFAKTESSPGICQDFTARNTWYFKGFTKGDLMAPTFFSG
jgi:hypothetical protein